MPLHFAASNDDLDVARLLLEAGADVKSKNKDGDTPIHYASSYGHVEVAAMLLAAGADVKAKKEFGDTPLHFAAHEGHLAVARLLIEEGGEVNASDEAGGTPLHYAAVNGHVDMCKLLLDRGADVTAFDEDGRTPLDMATSCEEPHEGVIALLESYESAVLHEEDERQAAERADQRRREETVKRAKEEDDRRETEMRRRRREADIDAPEVSRPSARWPRLAAHALPLPGCLPAQRAAGAGLWHSRAGGHVGRWRKRAASRDRTGREPERCIGCNILIGLERLRRARVSQPRTARAHPPCEPP
jgi:Ankyrin repeats (3 copies)/Ankyrin repeats (many copies)